MVITPAGEHVLVQAGDVIAFQGNSFSSKLIAHLTDWPRCTISHIGIVADEYNNLAEATMTQGENGVAIVGVQYKLDTYDGHVWHLPLLGPARAHLAVGPMQDFIWGEVNHRYSQLQAFMAMFDAGQALHNWASDWYCSKLVAMALVSGRILPVTFNMAATPSDLTKLGCFQYMRQLK